MAKAKRTRDPGEEKIPRWELELDYVESCNCNFGCPCNFSGYPTDGLCEALVAYHVKKGRFGKTRLDGLDVIYPAAWPKGTHPRGATRGAYHVKKGRVAKTRLDGLDVISAAAWPKAIHQGGGTLRLYISEGASPEQREALIRIFSGKARGNGPFELFAGTMATVEEAVLAAIEMTIGD